MNCLEENNETKKDFLGRRLSLTYRPSLSDVFALPPNVSSTQWLPNTSPVVES
jgi:hypothetical protein